MGKKITFVLAIILVSLTGVLISFYLTPKYTTLKSPLVSQGNVLGINLWFPGQIFDNFEKMDLTSKSAFFVETGTGTVLYSKNPKEKLPIASLVKIMTTLIALESKSLSDAYVVSSRASEMEPDKMFLIPGEKFTQRELLYGVFLISANDAAEVLAEGSGMGREQFISNMNAKAKQLGMENTLFVNPTGLDEDGGNSYSTSYDLTILTRYAIKHYPVLLEISQTPHVFWEEREGRQSYDMYSGINLLTTYPGVVGFKTGFTPAAGLTLITVAVKEDKQILGVLLGSENRREEAKELLDYSFNKLGL